MMACPAFDYILISQQNSHFHSLSIAWCYFASRSSSYTTYFDSFKPAFLTHNKMYTSQVIALAFALVGAIAAPAPSASGAAKGPKVPGTFNLYYCEDPSDYAFAVQDVSVTPRIPMP